ncbi:hypothetical protein [Rhodovulum sp. FJ3]|uniref:hypothetical protein n=1 Tax=Rhodovulum sp. FJ3 TaxID=3079053 RepID=UPI00293DB045|nr:hypothetical protein [Rhodovulum sp. FJ3]MDV4166645.1 hypothetical protein [Rhodovulum sp. FJ3]MEC8630810.1 hypothetical protein [Pseudomonadota bacterium]
MSDQKISSSASIMFDGPTGVNFVDLINDLQRVFRNIALDLDVLSVEDHSHILFGNSSISVRISLAKRKNASDLFRDAQRPPRRKASDAMLDVLLSDIQDTVQVRVSQGTERQLPERVLLAACYHTVRHVQRRYQASLIYWRHTDTLFTAEEFENPMVDAGNTCPQSTGHERLDAATAAHAETMDRFDTVMAYRVDTDTADTRLRRARDTIFHSDLIEEVDTKRERPAEQAGVLEQMTVYVMTITLMVLSFPIGFAMLVYNVLRGENLQATARIMSLTGVGLGFTTVNVSQALAGIVY